jgi:hypothetical protein
VHLIAEDKGLITDFAWDIMVESGDYGAAVFEANDGDAELDEITESNIRASNADRLKAGRAKEAKEREKIKRAVHEVRHKFLPLLS